MKSHSVICYLSNKIHLIVKNKNFKIYLSKYRLLALCVIDVSQLLQEKLNISLCKTQRYFTIKQKCTVHNLHIRIQTIIHKPLEVITFTPYGNFCTRVYWQRNNFDWQVLQDLFWSIWTRFVKGLRLLQIICKWFNSIGTPLLLHPLF